MMDFIGKLQRETRKKIERIETSDKNILKCSLDASLVLGDAFQQLKAFIATYTFRDEAEEIEFFKVVKPGLCCRLIYYRKLYNIEMNRPVGTASQRAYLVDEIKGINRYNAKRSDFVRYYRSGLTHLDSMYYLRDRTDTALYLETFQYERDPNFSTNCDYKVSRIKASELLMAYLTRELEALEQHRQEQSLPRVRITWGGTKTELAEQLFAWDSRKTFGSIPFTQLSDYIQTVFNIELDHNFSRKFSEMRIRNRQTPFLDSLKEALLKRMARSRKGRSE